MWDPDDDMDSVASNSQHETSLQWYLKLSVCISVHIEVISRSSTLRQGLNPAVVRWLEMGSYWPLDEVGKLYTVGKPDLI